MHAAHIRTHVCVPVGKAETLDALQQAKRHVLMLEQQQLVTIEPKVEHAFWLAINKVLRKQTAMTHWATTVNVAVVR